MNIDDHILLVLASGAARRRPVTIGDFARRFGVSPRIVLPAAQRLVENGLAVPSTVLVHGVPTFHGLMPLPEADHLANRWGLADNLIPLSLDKRADWSRPLEVLLALIVDARGTGSRIPKRNGLFAPSACAQRHRHALGEPMWTASKAWLTVPVRRATGPAVLLSHGTRAASALSLLRW
jgi:hypothetical protein